MIAILVIVHGLAVTVWTGGHLVPDLGVLPVARRERNAGRERSPEAPFEPLPIPITGRRPGVRKHRRAQRKPVAEQD